VAALVLQLAKYIKSKDAVLSTVTAALIVLAGFMVYEVITQLRRIGENA
jgi:hypothetical protein